MAKVNDWDEPLFDIEVKPRRRTATAQRVIRAYSGKPVTCHVCIISVTRGVPMTSERLPSTHTVTEPDGRVWMLCGNHTNQVRDGLLALPFDPPERKRK